MANRLSNSGTIKRNHNQNPDPNTNTKTNTNTNTKSSSFKSPSTPAHSSSSSLKPAPSQPTTLHRSSAARLDVKMQDPWRTVTPVPVTSPSHPTGDDDGNYSTVLLVFVPVLFVILTVLLGLVIFLVAVLYMRRKRGIRLLEDGGPLDLSKGDGIIGEGGLNGVEARWLETVDPDMREAYTRAKDWQAQYPPSSIPTDITLSQFLSIQEKGVSAWAFEPDYEENLSLYVQSRTEITFLSDGPGMHPREGGGNSVMANLPLPKLNEVYYWEVKLYDKPATTEVAIGLATKPYPSFRLPGWNKFSVAYFASDGFKSHNFPFAATSHGPSLAEGDVLGVGYRPRTGAVFFTRNGRKLDDAYTGLHRLNLFPTVGANGPCTLHVNLGQAGFVFIEANVKKWGLAPMTGTLAPPPAYGSERGSILLEAGYGTPGAAAGGAGSSVGNVGALLEAARNRAASAAGFAYGQGQQMAGSLPLSVSGSSSPSPSAERRARKKVRQHASDSHVPSPLRPSGSSSPRTYTPSHSHSGSASASGPPTYVSPSDSPSPQTRVPPVAISPSSPSSPNSQGSDSGDNDDDGSTTPRANTFEREQSPVEHNPPTPNLLDISMHSLRGGHYFTNQVEASLAPLAESTSTPGAGPAYSSASPNPNLNPDSPPPPGYAPLDPHVYANGLPTDLPEDMVNQAIAAMTEADARDQHAAPGSGSENGHGTEDGEERRGFGWFSFGGGRSG